MVIDISKLNKEKDLKKKNVRTLYLTDKEVENIVIAQDIIYEKTGKRLTQVEAIRTILGLYSQVMKENLSDDFEKEVADFEKDIKEEKGEK